MGWTTSRHLPRSLAPGPAWSSRQWRAPGRDLTNLDGEQLDQARLRDLWQQVVALRKARIAHRDLGLSSVMVDEQGQGWLVDFDRAEAATDQLLDRDLTTLLAALDGVADPALVHTTAEQALGPDTMARVLPPAATSAPRPAPPKDPDPPQSRSDPPPRAAPAGYSPASSARPG